MPKPDSAKHNVLAALEHGAHVVIGTSGLPDDDFADMDVIARQRNRAVLACGNFALTVVLLQKFAEMVARLARVRPPEPTIPIDQTIGPREVRGATLSIRHDSGSSARPYVDGALIAIRRVSRLSGLHRGLDAVLDV